MATKSLTAPAAVVAAFNLRKRTVVSFGGNRCCRRGVFSSAGIHAGFSSAGILPAF